MFVLIRLILVRASKGAVTEGFLHREPPTLHGTLRSTIRLTAGSISTNSKDPAAFRGDRGAAYDTSAVLAKTFPGDQAARFALVPDLVFPRAAGDAEERADQ